MRSIQEDLFLTPRRLTVSRLCHYFAIKILSYIFEICNIYREKHLSDNKKRPVKKSEKSFFFASQVVLTFFYCV